MNKIKQAVILAAGLGARLASLDFNKPKGFLEIGGKTLIARSVDLLKQAGIQSILIVAGYEAHYYHAFAEQHVEITVIENPRYAESGSLYSLYLAREHLQNSFLLLESDLIYEPRALELLLGYEKPNATLVSGFTHSGDEVYIEIKDEKINQISKDKTRFENISGELVGISLIDRDLFKTICSWAEKYFAERDLNLHYEESISAVARTCPVYACKADDLIWAEIDDETHYRRVISDILPRLGLI